MELDAEPAQKPLAKIRQAKRFLRAGEEIVAAAKAAQEEFWSDLLDGSMDERCHSYSSSAAIFPRKPRLVSECNAWVRAGPRRVCRENPAPRCVVVLYRDSTRSALWKFAVAEFAIS